MPANSEEDDKKIRSVVLEVLNDLSGNLYPEARDALRKLIDSYEQPKPPIHADGLEIGEPGGLRATARLIRLGRKSPAGSCIIEVETPDLGKVKVLVRRPVTKRGLWRVSINDGVLLAKVAPLQPHLLDDEDDD